MNIAARFPGKFAEILRKGQVVTSLVIEREAKIFHRRAGRVIHDVDAPEVRKHARHFVQYCLIPGSISSYLKEKRTLVA